VLWIFLGKLIPGLGSQTDMIVAKLKESVKGAICGPEDTPLLSFSGIKGKVCRFLVGR